MSDKLERLIGKVDFHEASAITQDGMSKCDSHRTFSDISGITGCPVLPETKPLYQESQCTLT